MTTTKGDRCRTTTKNPKVPVGENGRKAIFINDARAEYEVVEVDGCLITTGVRCDRLVSEVGVASALVEFKGGDVGHACKQLIETAENPSVKPLLEEALGFLIVSSRYPRFDTAVRKAKDLCAKRFKAGFHVVCNQREVHIRKLVTIRG